MTEHLLINLDKRGAEWVVVAYLARDEHMLSALRSGKSPHVTTGHLMTGAPVELIEKEAKLLGEASDQTLIEEIRASKLPELAKVARFLPRSMTVRQMGKKSNHGLNYDESWNEFSFQNEIEVAEAKKYIALYHRAYPGIRETYHREIRAQLESNRTLVNCFGRKVYLMGAMGRDLWKQGYAFMPSSTVADMVNQGIILAQNDPSLHALGLLAQVHDSGLFQHPLGDWRELARICIRVGLDYFSPEIEYHGRRFTIPTDLKIGRCWGSTMMQEVFLQRDEARLADDLAEAWERCRAREAA